MFRTFVHVFLIHSKRKLDWRYEKYQTRIGKLFTIFDEALVILLMMNSWSCYEEKSQIGYQSPQKKRYGQFTKRYTQSPASTVE